MFSAFFSKVKELWLHSKLVVVTFLVLVCGVSLLLGLRVIGQSNIFSNQSLSDVFVDSANVVEGFVGDGRKLRVESAGVRPPDVVAKAVLVEDLTTGVSLFEKNSHERYSPASTTKMMTALVGIESFADDGQLEVPTQALVSGSSMGLKEGEVLSFRSLLYGMLLNSGNDAAYTIAANYPGGIGGFVERMNEKVVELGLSNTHFSNPAGFDIGEQYSSAYDLAQIAKRLEIEPRVAGVVATKKTTVVSGNGDSSHVLNNLNQLLGEEGVVGVKTGTTNKSGENLVALVERDGKRVMFVVLGSEDRFVQTRRLIDWVFSNFTWVWR